MGKEERCFVPPWAKSDEEGKQRGCLKQESAGLLSDCNCWSLLFRVVFNFLKGKTFLVRFVFLSLSLLMGKEERFRL